MPIEVDNEKDLERIRADIELAHEWAKNYFHPELMKEKRLVDDNLEFVPLHGMLGFPQPDTLEFTPYVSGQAMPFLITYRLHFKKDGGLTWEAFENYRTIAYLIVRPSPIALLEGNLFADIIKEKRAQMPEITGEQAFRLGSALRHWSESNKEE